MGHLLLRESGSEILVLILLLLCISPSRILEIMEALAVSYPIPETDASDSINFDLTHLSVTISQVDQEMFAGFEFTPSPANITENGEQPSDLPFSTVSLSTPPSLFDNITLPHTSENGSSLPRISSIVYETDGLFLGPFSSHPIVVTSVIATATLSVGSHIVEVSDLDPPIILVFAKLGSISSISCASWNFDGKLILLNKVLLYVARSKSSKGHTCNAVASDQAGLA